MTASTILSIKQKQRIVEKALESKGANDREIQNLMEIKGISTITASTIKAEIIDIRRFVKDDNLASIAGLGRKTDATGDKSNEKKNYNYNRRLKDILLTTARNFVHFNPDHHLTGYFRSLLKTEMKRMEAYKRVARSLIRIIFKRLYSLIKISNPVEALQENEGSMANGRTRNTHVLSNIPPSDNTIKKRSKGKYQRRKEIRNKCLT